MKLRLASLALLSISFGACTGTLNEASETGTEDATGADSQADEAGEEADASASSSEGDGDGDDGAEWSSGDGDADTGDGDGDTTGDGDGDGDTTETGDGDGDTTDTGDGDGDTTDTGDGDGDTTDTGDGDGDTTDTGGEPEELDPFGGNGNTCGNAFEIYVPAAGGFIEGNTQGGGQHQNSAGSCEFGEQSAPDHTYDVIFETGGTWTVSTDTSITDFNTVIYALDNCLDPDSNIVCDGSSGGNGGDSFDLDVTAGALYQLVVDGEDGDSGNYRLVFTSN